MEKKVQRASSPQSPRKRINAVTAEANHKKAQQPKFQTKEAKKMMRSGSWGLCVAPFRRGAGGAHRCLKHSAFVRKVQKIANFALDTYE